MKKGHKRTDIRELPSNMSLNKSSQKRLRNEDEESEDMLPRAKRQEQFFNNSLSGEWDVDDTDDPHYTQVASASSMHVGQTSPSKLLHRQNSAEITMALHNTHLSHGQHYQPQLSSLPPYHNGHCHQQEQQFQYHQQQQRYQDEQLLRQRQQQQQEQYHQQPYMEHPSLLKDSGVIAPLPHNSLGPLPDVVHESNDDYYCHVNRMLRSAHFERLKRVKEVGHSSFSGDHL